MKLRSIGLAIGLGLGMASPAWSIMIGGNEVGGLDTIISITSDTGLSGTSGGNVSTGCDSSSGDANELCWAQFFTGTDTLDQYAKPGDVPIFYEDVGGVNYGAFDLSGNPEFYIVKNAGAWILMENLDDFGWGVLDVTSAQNQIVSAGLVDKNGKPVKLNLGDAGQTTISHVTHYNDGATPVPEPASIALLGAGLVGFGMTRLNRRRRNLAA